MNFAFLIAIIHSPSKGFGLGRALGRTDSFHKRQIDFLATQRLDGANRAHKLRVKSLTLQSVSNLSRFVGVVYGFKLIAHLQSIQIFKALGSVFKRVPFFKRFFLRYLATFFMRRKKRDV